MINHLEVLHAIPGRIRVRLEALRNNPQLSRAIEESVGERIESAQARVSVNPRTGSLLVEYIPGQEAALLPVVEELHTRGLLPEGFSLDLLEQAVLVERLRKEEGDNISSEIQRLVESLNQKVRNVFGGVGDLKELIPLGLLGLGISSVLRSKKKGVPTWLSYFYLAFATYTTLHPSITSREGNTRSDREGDAETLSQFH